MYYSNAAHWLNVLTCVYCEPTKYVYIFIPMSFTSLALMLLTGYMQCDAQTMNVVSWRQAIMAVVIPGSGNKQSI